MIRYMKVVNGRPVGDPHDKPSYITISPGVTVGCAHWPDSELAKYGEYPCWSNYNPIAEREVGWRFETSTRRCIAITESIPVEEVIPSAVTAIASAAEITRMKYLTPGDGKMLSYAEKAKEADPCLANYTAENPPPEGTYKLLDSEVGITYLAPGVPCANAYEVAQVVEATRQFWKPIEAVINRTELEAKNAVKLATTATEVQDIIDALQWP